jgi:aldose 1-epimerase
MANSSGSISQTGFGRTPDGRGVEIFTLRNVAGYEARITNYGGIVVSLKVPDKSGVFGDVVLGCDTLEGYFPNNPYLGCLVGRFGNRIAKARFNLNGKTYQLAANNGENSLHGGLKGFDKVVWKANPHQSASGPALELTYTSPDGEEGYPGNLSVTALYTLTADNALRLDYTATTDADTVINFTQHSYFNLAGQGTVLDHEVMIDADRFTPINASLIPTGELRSVEGTPMDFRNPMKVGARINQPDQQLKLARGYDHNWMINKPAGELGLQARVFETTSGRVMEVLSTEPGVQFYTGNFLDGTVMGKGGLALAHRAGLCFEPQHYPDSPNQPSFPSTVIKPGQTFHSTIIYRFTVK